MRLAGGDSLNIELARRDLESETNKRYKGFVVRSRLKRVLNEAVKSNATAREEEVRRFPGQYIDSVKPFRCTFMINLPTVLISCFRSFAAILLTSPVLGQPKQLAARVWLLNEMSMMC